MTRTLRASGWFVSWLLVGAGLALGVLSILTIGILVLVITAGAAALLATRRNAWRGLPGLISGCSLPVFYVAYLNRDGPGTICEHFKDGGESCTEQWSPWPRGTVGLLLLLAGIAVFVIVQMTAVRREEAPTTSAGSSSGP